MIRDVTDLSVYTESLDLIKHLYDLLRKLPKSETDSINQLKRAAKSISANISEGFAKRSSEKEFKRFLKISIGSSDEVVTHFRTIYHAVPRLQKDIENLAIKYKTLSKRINKLHSIWRSDKF
ncbi:MAG: four helix bundle protein [bacterium]|nr:four helix bundle protein [Candidatus Microgenomates bacterium CPR3]MCQ3945024.1 four helix bundle protein [bacterium]RIK52058.1 MAG: four helix bundle protein [Candidatus Microgenomates bacterium]